MLWISKAAQLGHPGAQHQLGLRYRRASFNNLRRNELESNLEAFKWFRLAANQGHRASEVELGMISLSLTREQVNEGNQRAAAFVPDCESAVAV
jgi:TPR repeat protein